jgi:hypothetical protein
MMSDEIPSAQNAEDPKLNPLRKAAKKKTRAKQEAKRDSHGGRPRSLTSYWIEVLKDKRLRGKDRADAIRELEKCQREEKRKKVAKPKPGNGLRAILNRDPKTSEPPIDAKTIEKIEDIAKSAENANPQIEEVAPQLADAPPESKPLTFDAVMAQIAEQSKKSESVADITKRLREVPVMEPDAATRRLVERAWSKAH